ncbi:MAG: bifunctional demethylmenaquinone methyltransferase/2-methoxy-6-polyprenyl-1,4-benzoquinol methylase UbiE [Muribaculaceae bacterium]|nr:bifunctional demethylmenaquinone methyltransferase/2-methoxy-6-polyprenyl-1,4-benzoquinol methylase UbiE [Muribaculaceae bacterium]
MEVEKINPYESDAEKGQQVELMFDTIARHYDIMNTAMSLGQHKRWRNKALKAAVAALGELKKPKILDIATGTGDLTFRLHKIFPDSLITGIDLSEGMLEIAKTKLAQLSPKEQKLIAFGKGDSLAMPFHDGEFDMITVAYGVRNFSDLRKGIAEMRRVLREGGVLCIIELSTPKGVVAKSLYNIYAGKLIPWLGKRVSGDANAYSYLPESIAACPQRENMAALLYAEKFTKVEWHSLSLGALTYYIAR